MKLKSALIGTLVVSIAGLIFSGYLSYYNLWGPGCKEAIISCGPNPVNIFGLPQCIYGFFMYLIVGVLAVVGLQRIDRRTLHKVTLGVGIFGLLFSGSLSVYELFFLDSGVKGLPACVYGFVLYLLIVIFISLGLRRTRSGEQPVEPALPNQPPHGAAQ